MTDAAGAAEVYELDVSEVEYLQDGGVSWPARICAPKGAGPFPALLYVHGGAWNGGNRNGASWLYEPLGEAPCP